MAHDGKKVLYFVKKVSEDARIIRDASTRLLSLKAEWVAANPDVTEEPVIISNQQALDFNVFSSAIKNAISDNITILNELETIADANPSHNPNSMNDWD